MTYRQFEHLKLLPCNPSDIARELGETASQARTTLDRLEGTLVVSNYYKGKRVFHLTPLGVEEMKKSRKGWR